MAIKNNITSQIPAGGATHEHGVMVLNNGVLAVNVKGNVLPARYADPVHVETGDAVLVDLLSATTGQAFAVVRAKLTTNPRPTQATVTAVPGGSPTITVTGTDGTPYTATFLASYTPTVNDNVRLAWSMGRPTVTGRVGVLTATLPAAPLPKPPGPPAAGTTTYTASDSDTFWAPGGWGSWAGGGSKVFQGDYGNGPVAGAWFYAGAGTQLSGTTVKRIQFKLGTRLNVGSWGAPVDVLFYAISNKTKPGKFIDVSRVVGPFTLAVAAGARSHIIDLPLTFGATLLAGGGIGIYGGAYAGFNGRNIEADSGLLSISWTR